MKIFIIILILATSFTWGYIQPILFPIDEHDWLYIVTALVGAAIIGVTGGLFYSEFDDD